MGRRDNGGLGHPSANGGGGGEGEAVRGRGDYIGLRHPPARQMTRHEICSLRRNGSETLTRRHRIRQKFRNVFCLHPQLFNFCLSFWRHVLIVCALNCLSSALSRQRTPSCISIVQSLLCLKSCRVFVHT